ncbi:MAG: hypothetical protein RMJ15_02505 [Nitrososphaerota archaeon]|nr:hypothetical protein [Candidatus Bathyarchaeota archaeon]MDW8022603.1 hypothetical protein [Nitrososphaerota archaeon]
MSPPLLGFKSHPPAYNEPHTSDVLLHSDNGSLFSFSLYLLRHGNRESTIKRKLKFLKAVRNWLGEKFSWRVLARDIAFRYPMMLEIQMKRASKVKMLSD